MPKVRTKRTKAPKGFEVVEEKLQEFEREMRQAENESPEGKRRCETLWPIFQINHKRSRYIYEMFYKRKEIDRKVYEFCLREGYADAQLIAKWKKTGYERLCCLQCINPKDHNFGTTCICRVPKSKLESQKSIQCVHCGCKGCASGD